MKIAKVNNLSKYEKKFIIFDLIFTGGMYGYSIIIIILHQNLLAFVLAIAYLLIHAWVRKLVWNGMERKEQQELLNIPEKEKLKKLNVGSFYIFKKEGVVGDKAMGQWEK